MTRIVSGRIATGLASPPERGVRGRCADGRGPSLTLGLQGLYDELARSVSRANGRLDGDERRESMLDSRPSNPRGFGPSPIAVASWSAALLLGLFLGECFGVVGKDLSRVRIGVTSKVGVEGSLVSGKCVSGDQLEIAGA